MRTVASQLDSWQAAAGGAGWFAEFAATATGLSDALRADLDRAASVANAAFPSLRDWLRSDYLPATTGTPDDIGADRYRVLARYWTGSDLDLAEAYEWGWSEYRRIWAEMIEQAVPILPGSTPKQAMDHLEKHGQAIDGVAEIRRWLQDLMDQAMTQLNVTHFDLPDPIKVVEARIAQHGGAARTTRTRRWTSPGPARPGCRRWARRPSRSGVWSAPGTTRACPAITCSSRSGRTSPASYRRTRRRSGA